MAVSVLRNIFSLPACLAVQEKMLTDSEPSKVNRYETRSKVSEIRREQKIYGKWRCRENREHKINVKTKEGVVAERGEGRKVTNTAEGWGKNKGEGGGFEGLHPLLGSICWVLRQEEVGNERQRDERREEAIDSIRHMEAAWLKYRNCENKKKWEIIVKQHDWGGFSGLEEAHGSS